MLLMILVMSSTGRLCAAETSLKIDADFPGGNIIVEKIEGNDAYIAQDPRDTDHWWFYYYFRVRGAAGRSLTFHWTNRNPMAELGPAVSTDAGKSWRWLGKESLKEDSFVYQFHDDASEVRFCLAMPYQLADLQRFVDRNRDHPAVQVQLHATTPKGRPVYRLHVGDAENPQYRVVLTCRHHSCEMMASWVLEGVLDAVLTDQRGRWLQDNVEILAIPMMDVDGVEDGDQGKNRSPHDHNRDYEGEPLYASVRANKGLIPAWSSEKLRIFLDLHCPWVRGGGEKRGSNEQIFFVGPPDERIWAQTNELASFLEAGGQGPLNFLARHNLPWGEGWNTMPRDQNLSSQRWAATLPGIDIASTVEIPYAIAGGAPVTVESARQLGRDLALAIRRYLENY